MSAELVLTPTESVAVRSATADALEVEATYAPHGSAPPRHLHPAQDEHFEVLAGSIRARIDGQQRDLRLGDTLDIPCGVVHQMWNPGAEAARVAWRTTPVSGTLDWFRALDALQREGRTARNGLPGPLALATLLTEYRDVIRFSAGPAPPLVTVVLALLAPLGRLRRYGS